MRAAGCVLYINHLYFVFCEERKKELQQKNAIRDIAIIARRHDALRIACLCLCE
jgi:hypothetical protein